MSEAISPVSGRRYGLATVCRVWRVARSGVYRHLTPPPATPPGRPGPVGAMPDGALARGDPRPCWPPARFMARVTARCGPGCAPPAPAPLCGACCG